MSNLEKALIDEINMILESYDDYENIELKDNIKEKIAKHIINNDYQIWEDLNCIIANCIDEILKGGDLK